MQPKLRSFFFYTTILLLTFGAVILIFLALFLPAQPKVPMNAPVEWNQYTAKSVGYQVVIYQTGQSDPVMITPIDIRTLPDADQQALSQGIPLRDATELARLLEDYDA